MTAEPIESAIADLVRKRVVEVLDGLREAVLIELGVDATPPPSQPVHALPPPEEVTKVRRRRRKTTKRARVSTPSRKRLAVRERVNPAHDLTGFQIGSFYAVEKTAERYYGQSVWLFRCRGCGTEKKLATQLARRRKNPPKCKCRETTRATSPKADRPTPVAQAPAKEAKAPVRTFNPRQPAAPNITGETCGTFVVGERRDVRRNDGSPEWSVQCTECGQKRAWSARELKKFQTRGMRCPCQGGRRRGRPPKSAVRPALEEPKNLDDLDPDAIEQEYLRELEQDRSIPRIRPDEPEHRSVPEGYPDGDDDESEDDEDDQETEELGAAGGAF